jgi:hypothetical protein
MFSDINAPKIPGWICVYTTSTELEANMVRNYLESNEIEVQILSKQDSAYALTVGYMAVVFLYVPEEISEKAEKAINEWKDGEIQLTDDNLVD